MRYLILSDIHSNIEALDACLQRARTAGYDSILCCGDIVGYGPDPAETVNIVRDLGGLTIRGNHDRVAAGLDNAEQFNPHARWAAYWTRAILQDADREYLGALPAGPLDVNTEVQLVHGAVTHEDDYIFTTTHAEENFLQTTKQITFFGHSHIPIAFYEGNLGKSAVVETHQDRDIRILKCAPNQRLLVNPGSVGQPRDGDARAGFAVWDQERSQVEFYRVEYAIKVTQAKMRKARLPAYLIERLKEGR
jgi:predicted phosphodiesterase